LCGKRGDGDHQDPKGKANWEVSFHENLILNLFANKLAGKDRFHRKDGWVEK
jgi:hypothetical protein